MSYLTNRAVWSARMVSVSTILYPDADYFNAFSHYYLFSQKRDMLIDRWHSWVAMQIRSGLGWAILRIMLSTNNLMELCGGSIPSKFQTATTMFTFSCSRLWCLTIDSSYILLVDIGYNNCNEY